MATADAPSRGTAEDTKSPSYLILDTESVPDGRLLSLVKYRGESLSETEAVQKAQAEARERSATGSDFLPVSFQYPVAVCVIRAAADFKLQSITCLDAPDYRPAEIVKKFWQGLAYFPRAKLVTFNGRSFDGPFLMLRSAMLGIPAVKNLVGYRYAVRPHLDLLDVVSFFGASRKWNLDFTCKAFGVESPKEHGMDGYSVGPYYRAGRLREIAQYCRRDVEATARLYLKIEKTLLPALKDQRL